MFLESWEMLHLEYGPGAVPEHHVLGGPESLSSRRTLIPSWILFIQEFLESVICYDYCQTDTAETERPNLTEPMAHYAPLNEMETSLPNQHSLFLKKRQNYDKICNTYRYNYVVYHLRSCIMQHS